MKLPADGSTFVNSATVNAKKRDCNPRGDDGQGSGDAGGDRDRRRRSRSRSPARCWRLSRRSGLQCRAAPAAVGPRPDSRLLGLSGPLRAGTRIQLLSTPKVVAIFAMARVSSLAFTVLADRAMASAIETNHAATSRASSAGSFFSAAAAGCSSWSMPSTAAWGGGRDAASPRPWPPSCSLRDDLPDQDVRRGVLTRAGDGTCARTRLLQHRDRTVLPDEEDRLGDQKRRFGQRVPFVLTERGLVGHLDLLSTGHRIRRSVLLRRP